MYHGDDWPGEPSGAAPLTAAAMAWEDVRRYHPCVPQ